MKAPRHARPAHPAPRCRSPRCFHEKHNIVRPFRGFGAGLGIGHIYLDWNETRLVKASGGPHSGITRKSAANGIDDDLICIQMGGVEYLRFLRPNQITHRDAS